MAGDGFVTDSDGELSGLHLAWLGLLIGLLARRARPRTAEPPPRATEGSYAVHDGVVFVVATVLALLVCFLVMQRREGAADEWGYTFQAAVFAKGHVYSEMPRCQPYLESFYVFQSSGRLFSQYTPGWPLFMVPFVWLHAVWLAAPVSMGLMAVGMARLARSAMRGFGSADMPPSPGLIRAAGTWAAVLSVLGPMVLVNAGSRYPHVFVVGLFAWTLEAVLMVATPGLAPRKQVLWGLALGTAAVFDVAARPADGAFVGAGAAVALPLRRRAAARGVEGLRGGDGRRRRVVGADARHPAAPARQVVHHRLLAERGAAPVEHRQVRQAPAQPVEVRLPPGDGGVLLVALLHVARASPGSRCCAGGRWAS